VMLLLMKPGTTIKRGLDARHAAMYEAALDQAGCNVYRAPESDALSPSKEPSIAKSPRLAPPHKPTGREGTSAAGSTKKRIARKVRALTIGGTFFSGTFWAISAARDSASALRRPPGSRGAHCDERSRHAQRLSHRVFCANRGWQRSVRVWHSSLTRNPLHRWRSRSAGRGRTRIAMTAPARRAPRIAGRCIAAKKASADLPLSFTTGAGHPAYRRRSRFPMRPIVQKY